jgi:hypothetical protein
MEASARAHEGVARTYDVVTGLVPVIPVKRAQGSNQSGRPAMAGKGDDEGGCETGSGIDRADCRTVRMPLP